MKLLKNQYPLSRINMEMSNINKKKSSWQNDCRPSKIKSKTGMLVHVEKEDDWLIIEMK
jgi:hypothetical protein